MDPLTVLGTLWRHKWAALPVVVLTLAACAYVYLFAPRTYEATVSYALAAPDLPSNFELERDPALGKINGDNPYLRSADSSLLSQVVIAKLSDPAYVDQLRQSGLGAEFKVAPVASLGMGLVTVSASADSKEAAVTTAQYIGDAFTAKLKEVQRVYGADDRYLYSPILVRGPGPAQELFSNRLRSLIMVGIAGAVLLFGTVSVAQSVVIRRQRIHPAAPPGESTVASEVQEAATAEEIERVDDKPLRPTSGRRASTYSERQPLGANDVGELRRRRPALIATGSRD
jgi:hypothetical protein